VILTITLIEKCSGFIYLYLGYDMEDAMVINKSSIERGFAHGAIYASEV
jgi:DNA-directed RNA polymerase I subunit RPA2